MTVSVQRFPECVECGDPLPANSRSPYCSLRCFDLATNDTLEDRLSEPQEVEEEGQSDDWRTEDE